MRKLIIPATLSVLALLTACAPNQYGYANNNQPQHYVNAQYGRIVSVQNTTMKSDDVNVTGALIGGAAGALLGNQIGKGSGKTAATIAGAAGGAYAGNQVGKNYASPVDAYAFVVQLDQGGSVHVLQPANRGYFNQGERVRVTYDSSGKPSISY